MSRFAIQQISLNGTLYAGCAGETIEDGVQVNSDALDGQVQETAHHGLQTAPMMELSTRNLALLTALSSSTIVPYLTLDAVNGAKMVGGLANPGAPGYQAGTVHVQRQGLRGAVFATGIRWSRGGKAELACKGMFTSSDGVAAALASSLAVLPTQPVPDFGWVLTALTLAGSSIVAVDSLDLSIDPKVTFEYQAGNPEPIGLTGAGARGAAEIRLRATIGDCALGSGTGACSAVFTKLAPGGGLAAHTATFTLNSAWSLEETIGGPAASPMARVLTVRPVWDGTNNALSWAVT